LVPGKKTFKITLRLFIIYSFTSYPPYIGVIFSGKYQKNSCNYFRKLLNSEHQIVVYSLLRNAHTLTYLPLCLIVHISTQYLLEVFLELFCAFSRIIMLHISRVHRASASVWRIIFVAVQEAEVAEASTLRQDLKHSATIDIFFLLLVLIPWFSLKARWISVLMPPASLFHIGACKE